MGLELFFNDLLKCFWILSRVGGLILSMPIIGSQLIPNKIKIAISIVLTIMIMPNVDLKSSIDPISFNGVLVVVSQLVIGIMVGVLWHLIFEAFSLGGQIIAMQMGLGFAIMNDPQSEVSVPVLSQFYIILLTLFFLSTNVHIFIIEIITESFNVIPIHSSLSSLDYNSIFNFTSLIFTGALSLALPCIIALLIVNLGFGLMSKVSPQLNIFNLGFSITLIFGSIVIYFSIDSCIDIFENLTTSVRYFINENIISKN